jgi:hypothetical protein
MTWRQALPIRALFAVAVSMAAACTAEPRPKYDHPGDAQFRAAGDYFEINVGAGWETFIPRGMNLGIGTPGRFPSDLSHDVETYETWLSQMADMNANVVRLYTLHNPAFYEALGNWNDDHPNAPIYLIQGIWLDEPEEEHEGAYYIGAEATRQLDEEIEYVVDAVHGEATIALRFGKAYGVYTHDVSDWVMAWLPGHELLGVEVEASNEEFEEYQYYEGRYISMAKGLPIEGWVARFLDHVITYEMEKYAEQRPIAWSSWPVLDPMIHPTETSVFGQDLVQANFSIYETAPEYTAGLYASYHVYPFNPEFIIYQPDYADTTDSTGKVNSYFGYLLDLKSNHQGVPLLITEFGISSSMGVAHYNPNSYNHGGYSETDQAMATADLYYAILESGCAGGVAFEFMDEWFKRTWMTNPMTLPWQRARLWYDVVSPEQSFGAVSYYPVPGMSVTVDGNGDDWYKKGELLVHQSSVALREEADGSSTITDVSAAADPAFLFLRIDTDAKGLPAFDDSIWYIAISSVDGDTGDRQFPGIDIGTPEAMGAESMVVLDGSTGDFLLITDVPYDPTPRLNGLSPMGAVPEPNEDGLYSLATFIVNHNAQYQSEAKSIMPEIRYYSPGVLARGNSAKNTLSHFELGEGGILEIRLPWLSLMVTDPSSWQALYDDPATDGLDSRTTDGMRIMVAVAKATDDGPVLLDVAPRVGFSKGAFSAEEVPLFRWDSWDEPPEFEARFKAVYYTLKDAFGGT